MSHSSSNKGFTLIEVIITILIMSIISLVVAGILVYASKSFYTLSANADLRNELSSTANLMQRDLRESNGAASGSVSSTTLSLRKKYYLPVLSVSLFPDVINTNSSTIYTKSGTDKIAASGYFDPMDGTPTTTQSFTIRRVNVANTSWSRVARGGNDIYTVNLQMTEGSRSLTTRIVAAPMVEN